MTQRANECCALLLDTYRKTGSIKATTRLLGIGRPLFATSCAARSAPARPHLPPSLPGPASSTPSGKVVDVHHWLEAHDFIVVLSARKGYILPWTAFYTGA